MRFRINGCTPVRGLRDRDTGGADRPLRVAFAGRALVGGAGVAGAAGTRPGERAGELGAGSSPRGRRARVRVLVAALACLSLTAGAPSALAHEDPHEILHDQDVYAPKPPAQTLDLQLRAAIAEGRQYGAPIKVALIGSIEDMREVEQYMGRPGPYARVLAYQLSDYDGQILVVMPNGLATVGPLAKPLADRALAGVRVDRRAGPDGLARAAVTAVERLVEEARSARRRSDTLVPAAGLVGALAISAGGALVLGLRRRRVRQRRST
jgi:hypothetical protein